MKRVVFFRRKAS